MSAFCFMDPFFRAGVPQDYKGAQPCLPYHAMSEIAARASLKARVERDDAEDRGLENAESLKAEKLRGAGR